MQTLFEYPAICILRKLDETVYAKRKKVTLWELYWFFYLAIQTEINSPPKRNDKVKVGTWAQSQRSTTVVVIVAAATTASAIIIASGVVVIVARLGSKLKSPSSKNNAPLQPETKEAPLEKRVSLRWRQTL